MTPQSLAKSRRASYFAIQSSCRVPPMTDIDKALSDIVEIRSRIAAGTAFRGYGPVAAVVTGVVGLLTALCQSLFLPAITPSQFVWCWISAGVLSALVVRIEMQDRSRRHHSSLADAMIHQAVGQFLPAAVAALFLPLFLLRHAPDALWIMPGLWQILVSLGIFASLRSLPPTVSWGGFWYFLSGSASLFLASQNHALSPWMMGVPFLMGQCLIAALLYRAAGDDDDEA